MGISGSTVLSTETDFSNQFSASSVVVYQLLGVVTAPPFIQFPDTSSKSDYPPNPRYHRPKTNSTGATCKEKTKAKDLLL